jgi:hypothetical protein
MPVVMSYVLVPDGEHEIENLVSTLLKYRFTFILAHINTVLLSLVR